MGEKSLRCVPRCLLICLVLAISLLLGTAKPGQAAIVSDTVQTITLPPSRIPVMGPSPVTQSYNLIRVDNAVGTVILFAGAGGKLDLSDGELKLTSTNFLVRSRHHIAAKRFHTVVMDAASDFLLLGTGLRGQRTSIEHLSDIAAVINHVSSILGDPGRICLEGTSRGSISAAAYAAAAPWDPAFPNIDCLVLTASVTQPGGIPLNQNLLEDVALELINVPTYVASHANDACFVSPPSDVPVLKSRLTSAPRVRTKIFGGGFPPLSTECQSLSQHGFFGIEPRVVRRIGLWMRFQVGRSFH